MLGASRRQVYKFGACRCRPLRAGTLGLVVLGLTWLVLRRHMQRIAQRAVALERELTRHIAKDALQNYLPSGRALRVVAVDEDAPRNYYTKRDLAAWR